MAYRWACAADGACCRSAGGVVMTLAESMVVRAAAPQRDDLRFDAVDTRRVVLQPVEGTKVCPLLDESGKCSVYEARPYNCRRFACLIPDKATETLQPGGPLGCLNAEFRAKTDPQARVFLERYQRPAKAWARRMGWTEDMR